MASDGNSWQRYWVTRVQLPSQRSANTFRIKNLDVVTWRDAPAGLSAVLSGQASSDSAGDLWSGSQRLCRPCVCKIFTSLCELLTRFIISGHKCLLRCDWADVSSYRIIFRLCSARDAHETFYIRTSQSSVRRWTFPFCLTCPQRSDVMSLLFTKIIYIILLSIL